MKKPCRVRFPAFFHPFALGCFFVLCSLGGCERDQGLKPPPVPSCRMIGRYIDAAGAVAGEVYTYDRYHRVVASHCEHNGNAFSFRTFAYNEQHQLASQTFAVSREAPVTHTVTYRYNAQGQQRGWVAMENGRHTEVTRELDAEGNCTSLTSVTTDLNSGVSFTNQHVYQYENGNLVGSISDAGNAAERRWTFAYYPEAENKLRAHEEVVGTFLGVGATPSRNLVKTVTCVQPNLPQTDPEITHYTYEYNAKGFPSRIQAVRIQAGNTATSETVLEYDCK